jgi:hypothetical protein
VCSIGSRLSLSSTHAASWHLAQRDNLSAEFVKALEASYLQNGADTLESVRQSEPAKYLALIAALMPKAKETKAPSELNDLTDTELRDKIGDLLGLSVETMANNLSKYQAMLKTARGLARCKLSLGCPPGPGRGSWSCDASAILGRTG